MSNSRKVNVSVAKVTEWSKQLDCAKNEDDLAALIAEMKETAKGC